MFEALPKSAYRHLFQPWPLTLDAVDAPPVTVEGRVRMTKGENFKGLILTVLASHQYLFMKLMDEMRNETLGSSIRHFGP